MKDFQQALVEPQGYQVSYSAVRYYHFDREPPVSYLNRVAEVMKVRIAWLAAEQGEITEAEEERAAERRAKRGSLADVMERWRQDRTDFIRNCLPDGSPAQVSALTRFDDKLKSSSHSDSEVPWEDHFGQRALIAGAARFLAAADSARQQAAEAARTAVERARAEAAEAGNDDDGLPLIDSADICAGVPDPVTEAPASPEEAGEWYDAVLTCYARTVRGLGAPLPPSPRS